MSNRVIAIQTSKIDARLSVTRRAGSSDAFRLQLAAISEALSAGASVDVALDYMRDAQKDKKPMPPKPMICAIMDTTVRKSRKYAK